MDCQLAYPVGLLIRRSCRVLPAFWDGISTLLQQERERDAVAAACQDPRLPLDIWQSAFLREVAHLMQWCAYRELAARQSQQSQQSPAPVQGGEVLSLLPRHGIAVHVLRRALPFAALGIPVTIGFPPPLRAQGRAVAAHLAKALGITELVHLPKSPAPDLVARMNARPQATIVVTGRAQTVQTVQQATRHRVIGCTGRCAVLVAEDAGALARVLPRLTAHNKPRSCTRLVAAFLGRIHDPSWRSPGWPPHAGALARAYAPEAVLRRLRPSIVYRHASSQAQEDEQAPEELAGFAVIPCDQHGAVDSLVGFGRDPLHGWPGDFLL